MGQLFRRDRIRTTFPCQRFITGKQHCARTKASQAAISELANNGVRHIFGLPGTAVMDMLDGLYGRDDLRFVTVRHEQVAVSMADGYARVTGRQGVCLTTGGPGAANSIIGMTTAYKDSSPVVLLTGNIPPALWGRNTHNEWDQLTMLRPVTKWQAQARRPEDVPGLVGQGLTAAVSGRPGPVHIDLPLNLQDVEVKYAEHPPVKAGRNRLAPSHEEVSRAYGLILESERPVIFAGGGVVASGASSALREFAEALNIPVITTLTSRGCIPDDHPLCFGLAHGQSLKSCNKAVGESDLIIGLGTRFNDLATSSWTIISADARIIQVDIDPTEIGRNYPVSLGINADVGKFLTEMMRIQSIDPRTSAKWREIVQKVKKEIDEEREKFFSEKSDEKPIEPQRLVKIIMDTIKRDSIVAVGSGRHSHYGSNIMRYEPRTFLKSVSFGAMGFTFPAAMGAKVACPEKQVLALCGDSDFMMVVQDLETAVREEIGVVAVIFNDCSYSAQKSLQKRKYGKRYIGTDVSNPDFVKLAESFGAVGARVDDEKDVAPALEKLLSSGTPSVLEAVITSI